DLRLISPASRIWFHVSDGGAHVHRLAEEREGIEACDLVLTPLRTAPPSPHLDACGGLPGSPVRPTHARLRPAPPTLCHQRHTEEASARDFVDTNYARR